MPQLVIKVDGDGAWPDLASRPQDLIHLADDAVFEMSGLARGMQSDAPSVAFRLDLPDGHVVIAETSWRLFAMAFHAFAAHFGAEPDAVGTAIEVDLGGGGRTHLDFVADDAPKFVECELCGERREAASLEEQQQMVQWLYRHFREKHPGWTPPA